ncbi:MAG TPA: hypothetical protein PK760_04500, partial [Flavobacteriales bacterium]|nr:hypothetical protein [Flavobacteriales bacterium]
MLRSLLFHVVVVCLSVAVEAQEIARSVVSAGGGSAVVGGVQLDQSIGEPVTSTSLVGGVLLNQGFEQAEPLRLQLDVRAFLQGPFNATTMRMSDALRTAGYLPMTEPYTALGYDQVGGGGERTRASVLAVSGDDAIIDWVFFELR